MSLTSYHCSTPRYYQLISKLRCKGTTKIAHTQIFLEKNAFFGEKIAYGLQFATVASGECASAQAASEGTVVSLIERARPAHDQIFSHFLAKNMIFLCIFLRICVFFSNFAPYFVRGYDTRARNRIAE